MFNNNAIHIKHMIGLYYVAILHIGFNKMMSEAQNQLNLFNFMTSTCAG